MPSLFIKSILACSLFVIGSGVLFASPTYRVWVPGLLAVAPSLLELSLNNAALPDATKGSAYSYDFSSLLDVSGGTLSPSSVAWTASTGLPPGLTLNSNGTLSGTPSVINSSTFNITAAYTTKSDQASYTIEVNGVPMDVTSVAAGSDHSCAITTGGGVKCWGANSTGQLGNNSTVASVSPVDVVGLTSGVANLSVGVSFTCALTTSGAAKCWGRNSRGQLGDGTTTQRLVPVTVAGLASGVSQLVTGAWHACALTTSGGVKCWGENAWGEVGDNTYVAKSTPVDVVGLSTGVSRISLGDYYSCALVAGTAKCWGMNDYYQLGNGNTSDSSVPVNVLGLTGISEIVAGYAHTCALISGGVKCWGYNNNGQLGIGSTATRSAPVDVPGLTSGIASIYAGPNNTCVKTSGGGAKCWGGNWYKQVGDGTAVAKWVPTDVMGLSTGVAHLDVGPSVTCALLTGNKAKCWGLNDTGQLGHGRITDPANPKYVVGP